MGIEERLAVKEPVLEGKEALNLRQFYLFRSEL
jgi:hypothetical protein